MASMQLQQTPDPHSQRGQNDSNNTFGPAPPSLYFAEHLSRISSISLLIKTPANSPFVPAQLEFPSEGSLYLTLVYASRARLQISLPVPFAPSLALTRKSLAQEVLQNPWNLRVSIKAEDQRLRIQPHEAAAAARKTGKLFAHTDKEDVVPLSAKSMQAAENSNLQCTRCGAVVVRNSSLHLRWTPLPSETWAEMMDFWHCHKPSEPKVGAAHDHFNKSYAVSKFVPTKESAFVGLTYFLVDSTSLENTQTDSDLSCAVCNAYLGQKDSSTSFKLFKWDVNLSESSPVSPFYYVSAEIGELIAAHGVYTFAITTDSKTDAWLVIWVVNSDIQYTCTGSTSRRAYRVLYSSEKTEIPGLIKERGNDAVEQITVPDFVLASLETHLKSGNNFLHDASQSNKWNVSVLNKYNSSPL